MGAGVRAATTPRRSRRSPATTARCRAWSSGSRRSSPAASCATPSASCSDPDEQRATLRGPGRGQGRRRRRGHGRSTRTTCGPSSTACRPPAASASASTGWSCCWPTCRRSATSSSSPPSGPSRTGEPMSHRVLVTGMGGELGVRVANLLAARPDVEAVRGHRHRPAPPPHRATSTSSASTRAAAARSCRWCATSIPPSSSTSASTSPTPAPVRRSPPSSTSRARSTPSARRPSARRSSGSWCGPASRSTAAAGVRPTRPDESVRPDADVVVRPPAAAGRGARARDRPRRRRRRHVAAVRPDHRLGAAQPARAATSACRSWPSAGSPTRRSPCCTRTTPPTPSWPPSPQGPTPRSTSWADGATTPVQAARTRRAGRRCRSSGRSGSWPGWPPSCSARPLPDHVRELLVAGAGGRRVGRGRSARACAPAWSTPDVVRDLYEWAPVTYVQPGRGVAA